MSRAVLVLNAGSSSLKYQLIDAEQGHAAAHGLVERIGESTGAVKHTSQARSHTCQRAFPDHVAALTAVLEQFSEHGPDLSSAGVAAVGHRVVQGGERFADPVIIDDEVVAAVERLAPLAPLHNPGCLQGIAAARRVFPNLPQVAVFDTAFHQGLPDYAYTYAVPTDWTTRYGVRRYGFHGTSHSYVSRQAAHLLGRAAAEVNVIVAHLGNGASITAVRGGESVATSMGLTPLEGLVMGTRSGDIDPAVVSHLTRIAGMRSDEVIDALNTSSGLLGMTGAKDMREVAQRAAQGDAAAELARSVYCYRIKTYVGAYYAALGHLDAIAFTAGVGENDADVRARSLDGLDELGILVDGRRNVSGAGESRIISPDGSRVVVMVIPTNEELEIARQAIAVVDAR